MPLQRNTDAAARLLRLRAMVLMNNSETMSRPWFRQLERGVREGLQFQTGDLLAGIPLAQWQALLARSGMALEEVVALKSFASILVLRPEAGA
jgi:hypothetical protein